MDEPSPSAAAEPPSPPPATTWRVRLGLLLLVVVIAGAIFARRMRNATPPGGGRGPGGAEQRAPLRAHALRSTQALEAKQASVASLEATARAGRAAVESARLDLAHAHATAPIDGRTGLRQVDAGNLVSSSAANGSVVITRVDPIS